MIVKIGVSDPYEPPEAPAAVIDTSLLPVDEAADRMAAFESG